MTPIVSQLLSVLCVISSEMKRVAAKNVLQNSTVLVYFVYSCNVLHVLFVLHRVALKSKKKHAHFLLFHSFCYCILHHI